VGRTIETEMVKITLSAKWNNLIHIVEDTAILGRKMMMIVIMMMMMMEEFFDEKDFYSEFLSHLSFVFFFYRYIRYSLPLQMLH